MEDMLVSRRIAALLLLGGAFQWLVWPNFLRVIWQDPRSWSDGPTAFFVVHAVLTVASLVLGTFLLALGTVAWRRARRG